MASSYDLLVIGSGPGGYVAAIRASQFKLKVGVVERAELGGICLNWGCIPTKALLKSAEVFEYLKHAEDYGIRAGEVTADFAGMVKRSREVANGMSKGVQFLFKKNNIDVIAGTARVMPGKKVLVKDASGKSMEYTARYILIATGGRSKELPALKIDNEKIIGYRKAMVLDKQPSSMVIVGSGAIGTEFAYFYHSIGTQVTLLEFLPNIVPLEDEEVSKQLERIYKKSGINVMTNSEVTAVETKGKKCKVSVKTKSGQETIETDMVLSAVGISTNIEGIGLEETGIKTDKGKVTVDEFYRTIVPG